MRIRDIVIHIGNDFFQSFMASSNSVYNFIQSGLKVLLSARKFQVFGLIAGISLSVFSKPLEIKSPVTFANLDGEVETGAFWHKPQIWQSLQKERKIPVSVTRNQNQVWTFKGAGLVQAPRDFSVERAKDFQRLLLLPKHFSRVEFDEKTSTLHLQILFLGRERPLDLKLFEEKRENESRIYFRSRGPWLEGAEGVFLFKDQERQSAEVAILAQYAGDIKWVPDWLFAVSAEGVMHHVAEQLRKTLESDYKKEVKKEKGP